MALRKIIKNQSNDVLRKKADNVGKIDTKILKLLDDMSETLQNSGAKGLAAPQIGVSLRLIVIKTENNYLQLIDPIIIMSSGEQISFEGCLSLPGIYGKVRRPEYVVIQALGKNRDKIEMKASYRMAATYAHEIDHLDGILLIDKAFYVVTNKQNRMTV